VRRSGKLRWVEDEGTKRAGPVTVEDAVLKLYSAIVKEHGHLDEHELPTMIMELFRKIDEDGSGAIAINPKPQTLNPQPSTLNPQTLNLQPSTLNPQP